MSGIQTVTQRDNKEEVLYVMTIDKDLIISDSELEQIKAEPSEVEEELEERVKNEEDKSYKSKWDKRSKQFSCDKDQMKGWVYMLDEATRLSSNTEEVKKQVQDAGLTKANSMLRMTKVSLDLNNEKLAIKDTNQDVKQIIRLNNVYPRMDQLKAILDDENQKQKRSQLELLKLNIINATQLVQTLDDKLQSLFCILVINEPLNKLEFKQKYDEIKSKADSKSQIDLLVQTLEKSADFGKHKDYYSLLTLCHPNYDYIKKWFIFLYREKIDCQVDYNRDNFDILEDSTTILNSGATTSSMQQILMQQQQRQEQLMKLKKQQQELQESNKVSKIRKNQEELERMQSELSSLNESMTEEQEYSEKEIEGMMSHIKSMENSVQNKGEQLECLEKALEIRGEEENNAVIMMLKDEEMNKVKKVVGESKSKMREAYQQRIKELKEELKRQEEGITQEKGNYDELMINLIKGGLKKGSKSVCVTNKAAVLDKDGNYNGDSKMNQFIEDACSNLLNSNENAADLQGGLLDSINKCTQKELFCSECCQNQFGIDQLLLRQDCISDCQAILDVFIQNKHTFSVDLSNVIDPKLSKQIKHQVDQEVLQKQLEATHNRFKAINHHLSKNHQ